MTGFIASSAFFGVLISLGLYQLGVFFKKKLKSGLVNPLLIAIAVAGIVTVVLAPVFAGFI